MRAVETLAVVLACFAATVHTGASQSDGLCATAADCYAKATAADLAYLHRWDEQLICDTACSGSEPLIHCNQFGLGQNCRQCFNSKEAAKAYFSANPGQPNADTYALCPSIEPDVTMAPTSAPSVAPAPLRTAFPTRAAATLPPIFGGVPSGDKCCSTAADCYAKATAADLEQLNKFSESLICDASCSITGGLNCNIFGLCQNCRQCFNTMADVENYFNMFPDQKSNGFVLCPGATSTTPTPVTPITPTKPGTSGDENPQDTCKADCYNMATQGELEYLTKFGKQMICDTTCSTDGGSHCNMFGLDQDCRGCFNTQADADSYYMVFPDQKGEAFILCPSNSS